MRTAFYFLSCICLLTSCGNHKADETAVAVKGNTLQALTVLPKELKGIYTGDFNGSPIAITLNNVSNTNVGGYSLHKGLTRNISGSVESTASGLLRLHLSEPGDNQYDGTFILMIDTISWSGKGVWQPFKKGDHVNFELRKNEEVGVEAELVFTDSLQNDITLKTDGTCTYIYPTSANHAKRLIINGKYTVNKNIFVIQWEKSDVFSQQSVFKMIETKPYKGEEYIEKSLEGEGRLFTQVWD